MKKFVLRKIFREISVISNNWLMHNDIREKWKKTRQDMDDAGAIVSALKNVIDKVACAIELELSAKYKNNCYNFDRNLMHQIIED